MGYQHHLEEQSKRLSHKHSCDVHLLADVVANLWFSVAASCLALFRGPGCEHTA